MKGFSVLRVLRTVFAFVAALLAAFVLVLVCTGTRSFAVQSESMSPFLHRGDMVCVRRVPFEQLREGDVISAHFPESDGIFTHRIILVDAEKRQVYTRGDSSMRDDPLPTDASRIIGKYRFSIPYVGFLSLYLQNYTAIYILLGVALALITVRVVLSMRKKSKG